MCGIAGIVSPGGVPERAVLERMTRELRHRGPDDEGFFVAANIGLGFRRLAIIDLRSGNQPTQNASGTIRAVFNGEIYNFRALRDELTQAGHTFHTQGDAEVLPHLYEEEGPAMVERLRGMFALAIWDVEHRQLFAARDRAGEKPFYYSESHSDGGLLFASEMKSLLAAGVSREPDPRGIMEYLYHLYVPAPHSAFAAIAKLPPGHALVHRRGVTETYRYWAPTFRPAPRTTAQHVQGVREHVEDAVSSRLVSDVPVGAFLSGGIDSASVVAAMTKVHDGPVHTFTITFDGYEHYDESAEARSAAEHFGTDHHELRANLDGPGLLPKLVESFDEPFGNATAALLWSLSAATREHVKVVLTGDGADELFFGYPRFRGLQLAQRYRSLPAHNVRALIAAGARRLPEDTSGRHTLRRLREFLEAGNLNAADAYASWIGYFSPPMLRELLVPELAPGASHATDFLYGLFDGAADPDLNQVSRVELQSFLPFNVLEYADKMSMAHGLELRAPFVDHHLVDYVSSLPPELKLRRGVTKWALREAMGPDLPSPVLGRAKRGLNPPLGAWLAGDAAPLVRDLLSPRAVAKRGWFRPEAVAQLIRDQASGHRDRSLHIWALLVLELWFQLRVEQ